MKPSKNMVFKALLLYFSVLMVVPSKAQRLDMAKDSINAMLSRAHGTEKIRLLYDISLSLLGKHNDLALTYSLNGYRMAYDAGDSLELVRAGLVAGSALRRLQRLDSSRRVYDAVVRICENNSFEEERAISVNGIAVVCTLTADYDIALSHYLTALDLFRLGHDSVNEIRTLNNIGVVYYKLGNCEKALQYYSNCLDYQRKAGFDIDRDMIFMNMGVAHAVLGNFDQALQSLDSGFQACGSACSELRRMEALFAEGIVHYKRADPFAAKSCFERSFRIAEKIDHVRFQLDNIDYLTKICLSRGLDAEAKAHLLRGEKLLKNYPSFRLERSKIYSGLSDLYSREQDFRRAFQYQASYASLLDSLQSDEVTNNLMRLEAEHQEKENIARIAAQAEIIALNDDVIRHQSDLNKLFVLLVVISTGLVMLLFRNYRQKKRINQLLSSRVEERTTQLFLSDQRVQELSHVQELSMHKNSREFAELVNRVRGLCLTGLREISDPLGRTYLSRIKAALDPAVRLAGSEPGDR